MRQIYIIFGAPGSGKGTQAELLADHLKLPSVSTGDLLRHEEKAETVLGKKVAKLLDSGKLVSDEIIHGLVKERLLKPDTKRGFILDGYPRDPEQMKDLFKQLQKTDNVQTAVIEISDKAVMGRLSGRRVCDCGETYHVVLNPPKRAGFCNKDGKRLYIRHDDRPEVVKARLKTYRKNITPMLRLAAKKGRVVLINGELPMAEVRKSIWNQLLK
ncbi:MAG: nucleoside monophosphate kinase [Candidatus Falkowbacteria bacterium]